MSNDNDKDQEYQKNMGKRLRKIRKENALSQDDDVIIGLSQEISYKEAVSMI